MGENVQMVMDQVTQSALQSGQQVHSMAMQNAVHMQQLAQMASLQLLSGKMSVGQAYEGNHLRRGSEIDAQEAAGEGKVYSDSAAASFPREGQQLDALYHDDAIKSIADQVLAMVMAKVGNNVPPQTGGYSAQAPGNRAE